MSRRLKNSPTRYRRSDRGDTVLLGVLLGLALLAPLFVFASGPYVSKAVGLILERSTPTPKQPVAEREPSNPSAPTATRLPVQTAVPSVVTDVEPTKSNQHVSSWKPRIGYQHYGDGYEKDIASVAKRADWLMMKHGMSDIAGKARNEGYEGPLLKYMMTFQILGPGPLKDSEDSCKNKYTPVMNNAMWTDDFCEEVHINEDWFLHNSKGERLYDKEKNWDGSTVYDYYMNPGAPGFREFWVEQVKRQGNEEWDGLFLDNVAVDFNYLRRAADLEDGTIQEYGSNDAWQEALIGHLDYIKSHFPDMKLWGNMIEGPLTPDTWDPFLDHLDGFQEENFATNWVGQRSLTPDEWNAMLVRSEKALAKEKSVLLYGQGEQKDKKRMRFSLASYLLIASGDERAVFRYTNNSKYEKFWWYSEYERDLGLPRGERYRDGDTWVRDYQCGRVIVDPDARQGTIAELPCAP